MICFHDRSDTRYKLSQNFVITSMYQKFFIWNLNVYSFDSNNDPCHLHVSSCVPGVIMTNLVNSINQRVQTKNVDNEGICVAP